jgi:hypothetical protein
MGSLSITLDPAVIDIPQRRGERLVPSVVDYSYNRRRGFSFRRHLHDKAFYRLQKQQADFDLLGE